MYVYLRVCIRFKVALWTIYFVGIYRCHENVTHTPSLSESEERPIDISLKILSLFPSCPDSVLVIVRDRAPWPSYITKQGKRAPGSCSTSVTFFPRSRPRKRSLYRRRRRRRERSDPDPTNLIRTRWSSCLMLPTCSLASFFSLPACIRTQGFQLL